MENATEARFSPDGKWVAYVRLEGGKAWTADVYVLELATGKETRVTGNPDYDGQPSWAPDSKLLVYTSKRQNHFDLYLTSVVEGGERRLTWAGGRQADVAPDGVSIVYTSDELGGLDLFLTSLAGGIAKRLTSDPGREWFPRYSPDGRYIAYVSNQEGSDDVWLFERGTSVRRRLTDMPGDEVQPAWSPDSRIVVFSGSGGSGLNLFAVPVTGGTATVQSVPITGCDGLACQSTFPTFNAKGDLLLFTTEFNPLQPRLAALPVAQSTVASLLQTP